MVTVLAIADGASEPLRDGVVPTCLEAASTPAIDRLLHSGVLQRARTIPPGLLAGTEAGLPCLLGVVAPSQPGRGPLEAAGAGIALHDDEGAWRIDFPAGSLADAERVSRIGDAVSSLGARLIHLGAHRCLLLGPRAWGDGAPGSHQAPQAPSDAGAGLGAVITVLADVAPTLGRPWGTLARLSADVPRRLGRAVRVVTPSGVVAGIAEALGCTVEDAAPSTAGEIVARAADDDVVVVHDPHADDAAHARNRGGKIAAIERFDATVVAPIVNALEHRGGRLVVATDHGCDPATGAHDAAPVPVVLWTPHSAEGGRMPRWTERDAASLGEVPAEILLDEQLRMAAA